MLLSTQVQQQHIIRYLTISIFYPVQVFINQTTKIKNIFHENQKLKEEVANLSAQLAIAKEYEAENQRLVEMLEISKNFPFTLVPARVVVREPSIISRSAVINAGKNRGILPYMPVITTRGVSGRVVFVTNNLALVQLLIDPANRTSIMLKRTREIGILETENSSVFFIMFRAHADVALKDTVITSGMGGIYPKGLLVGVVSGIEENKDPLFKKAFVQTFENFDKLEEVFVVKLSSQWCSFKNELDSITRVK
jgi:rod shape-determining protein MreC